MTEHWQILIHFILNVGMSLIGCMLLRIPKWAEKDGTPTHVGWVGLYILIASGCSWSTWLWQIYHFTGATP